MRFFGILVSEIYHLLHIVIIHMAICSQIIIITSNTVLECFWFLKVRKDINVIMIIKISWWAAVWVTVIV